MWLERGWRVAEREKGKSQNIKNDWMRRATSSVNAVLEIYFFVF